MERLAVLQLGPPEPALEAALAPRFEVTRLQTQADPPRFLRESGERFLALVTTATEGATTQTLQALPALRVIASYGVGYDRIDLACARRAGVSVSNTPGVLHDCTADAAFGLMLDVARGLSEADRFVRRGNWRHSTFRLGVRVSGRKLGIVGLGQIGRAVAKRAGGFDMDVRYTTRRVVPDVPWPHEPRLVELARWADFLIVAVTGGEDTRCLVCREVLEALGPQGYLINVSRGSVVDETALVEILRTERIAGAGLDVYEHEPEVPSALLELDNVVLLPHVGSATEATRRAMGDLVARNLEHFVRTGSLLTPVSP